MKKITILLFYSVVFSACTKSESIAPQKSLSAFNASVIEYFAEVALGFEFGTASKVTRKYSGKGMKIFVGGKPTVALKEELSTIIKEINALASDGFGIEIVKDSTSSNFYVYFGAGRDYADLFRSQSSYVANNYGLFNVSFNNSNIITGGHMYVDIYRVDPRVQRHLLREELTQSLGLGRDSKRYLESIFQESGTRTTFYDPIDKELIRLLYHPKMKTGLNINEVEKVLSKILSSEQKAN